jgi:hypothetical protein
VIRVTRIPGYLMKPWQGYVEGDGKVWPTTRKWSEQGAYRAATRLWRHVQSERTYNVEREEHQ